MGGGCSKGGKADEKGGSGGAGGGKGDTRNPRQARRLNSTATRPSPDGVVEARNQGLTTLPKSVFNSPQDVRELWASQNAIAVLPRQIANLRFLESLYLMSNRLRALPPQIGELTQLRRLHLGYNDLRALPEEIGRLRRLQHLSAESNGLTTLPAAIGSLSALETLDLSSNAVSQLPPEINGLTSLTSLDLDGNIAVRFPSTLEGLRMLDTLSLRNAGLSAAPPEIGGLRQLHVLQLGKNQLTGLPDTYAALVNLTELSLPSNQFREVPPCIGGMESLAVLWLNDNAIESIPDSVGSLSRLEKLYMYDNRIVSVSEKISGLERLRLADLHSNRIEELPETFCELGQVRELNLRDNKLTRLPNGFGSLRLLANVDLRRNPLASLPTSLAKCSALTRLALPRDSWEDKDTEEAVAGGIGSVMAFLSDKETGGDPPVVVGEGGDTSGAPLDPNAFDSSSRRRLSSTAGGGGGGGSEAVQPPIELACAPTPLGVHDIGLGSPPIIVDRELRLWCASADGGRSLAGLGVSSSGMSSSSHHHHNSTSGGSSAGGNNHTGGGGGGNSNSGGGGGGTGVNGTPAKSGRSLSVGTSGSGSRSRAPSPLLQSSDHHGGPTVSLFGPHPDEEQSCLKASMVDPAKDVWDGIRYDVSSVVDAAFLPVLRLGKYRFMVVAAVAGRARNTVRRGPSFNHLVDADHALKSDGDAASGTAEPGGKDSGYASARKARQSVDSVSTADGVGGGGVNRLDSSGVLSWALPGEDTGGTSVIGAGGSPASPQRQPSPGSPGQPNDPSANNPGGGGGNGNGNGSGSGAVIPHANAKSSVSDNLSVSSAQHGQQPLSGTASALYPGLAVTSPGLQHYPAVLKVIVARAGEDYTNPVRIESPLEPGEAREYWLATHGITTVRFVTGRLYDDDVFSLRLRLAAPPPIVGRDGCSFEADCDGKWALHLAATGENEIRVVHPSAPSYRRYVVWAGHRVDFRAVHLPEGTKWASGRHLVTDNFNVPNVAIAITVTKHDGATKVIKIGSQTVSLEAEDADNSSLGRPSLAETVLEK